MKHSVTRRGNKLRCVVELDIDDVVLYPAEARLKYLKLLRAECRSLPKAIMDAADVLVEGDHVGEVKFWLKDKGFGFIVLNQRDVFVHQKHLAQGKMLEPGQLVRFKLRKVMHEGKDREEAVDVSPVERT